MVFSFYPFSAPATHPPPPPPPPSIPLPPSLSHSLSGADRGWSQGQASNFTQLFGLSCSACSPPTRRLFAGRSACEYMIVWGSTDLPTPYTLHPTPYTLHPTPYTLHPTPYTLHPTPYTPYTLHSISFEYPSSYTLHAHATP